MKAALDLRYMLLPYHYSLAHRMYQTGKLWMRPIVAEFPDDSAAAPLTSQWLDGELLVAPVLHEDSTMSVYLPEGTWYHFNSSQTESGPTWLNGTAAVSDIPVFVPAGSLIALAPPVQYSDALPGGPLQLHVYSGRDGDFTLVEDDGETTEYSTHGKVRQTKFSWSDSARTLSWSYASSTSASSPQMFSALQVTLFVDKQTKQSAVVKLDGHNAGSIVVK